MASEWVEVPLGQLVDIFDGPHATPPKTAAGPVFLGISNLVRGRLDLSTIEHLSEGDYVRWTRRVTPAPADVVFSYETRLGEAAAIPPGLRCCLGRRMGLLRAKPDEVDPRLLLYAYLGQEFQETLRARTVHGSTVDRIPLVEMAGFPIRVPHDLGTQRAIAHMLGGLDDKIELNRRMNETLEEMARAIFKSWFVGFDPVRANAEGWRSGLPLELAKLFPESLDDSHVPHGWGRDTLAALATLNPEAWSTATRPLSIRYVDLSNTKWGRIEAVTCYQQADAPSRAQRVLRTGDTLVGTVRPGNGSYALIADDGLTGSTGFAVLRPRRPEYREFVYLAATAADNIENLAHLADGGAYPAVRPEVVAATPVVRATDSMLAQFSRFTAPLLAAIAENHRTSRVIGELRDTLLPKLISGELRVKDAERIVETVA